jgi:hypothetical protein
MKLASSRVLLFWNNDLTQMGFGYSRDAGKFLPIIEKGILKADPFQYWIRKYGN